MPHIVIEHSKDISCENVKNFMLEIQKIVASVKDGKFDLEACKVRMLMFDEYLVGSSNEKNSSFFHITIKILEGRTPEVKKEVAQKVASRATEFLKIQQNKKARTDLSVDIVDMEAQTYQKISL